MSTNTRPNTDEQRGECVGASDKMLECLAPCAEALPEDVAIVLTKLFVPVRQRFTKVRQAYREAIAAKQAASRASKAADRVYRRTGRHWNKSVTDSEGRGLPQEIAKLIENVRPGELFGLPLRRKVDLTASLLGQLVHLPHLVGDPKRLAEFAAAHSVLSEKVNALEAAERTHRDTRVTLDATTAQFDRRWMMVVEILEEVSPELATKFLPTFPVKAKGKGRGKGKVTPPPVLDVPEVLAGEVAAEVAPVTPTPPAPTAPVTPTDS